MVLFAVCRRQAVANRIHHMTTRRNFLGSLITTKLIIGVTGILLFAYLILHIAGNLIVFLIHLFKAVRMTFENQSARPAKYAKKEWAGGESQKSVASSSMVLTGLAILIFVPIHVWQFKYGTHYEFGEGMRDLFRTEAENFSSPLMVAF